MRRGCKAVAMAAVAVLSSVGYARADMGSGDELTLKSSPAPIYLDDTATNTPPSATPPPPDKPLAGELKKLGANTGDIAIYGFIEGSYTASFSNPPGDFITGRVFDIDNEEVLLNQIDLSIEKTVDAAAAAKDDKFNLGGKFEIIYGSDARFIHANGMNFYGGAAPQLSPENQFDIVQAYADFGVPVGNGLLIRAGKMVTHMGYETINPTTNPLYSHTYLFGYAIPFTHTGVMAFYNLSDKVTVMGGFSRGWDQSLKDNNGQLDYLGQLKWVASDKVTAYVNFVTGPEEATGNQWRTVIDGIVTYAATDALTFAANGDFGIEPGADPSGGGNAQWYGVALYAGYKFCDAATFNVRGEWFADPQGARGLGGDWYEVTAGLAIKPMPHSDLGSNLLIRPEIRWDYSADGAIDGGTQNDQWTAAIDAIFTF